MLAYDYRAGSARLDDLPEIPISPHLYVMCDRCATSLRAPRGWILDDRRVTPHGARPQAAPAASPAAEAPVAAEAQTEVQVEVHEEGQRQLAFGYRA